jgi:hypothetical protein
VLLLVALAAQAAPAPPPPKAAVQASASVRIERPSAVSAREWEQQPESAKRELRVLDEQGRAVLLRLVENQ